MYSRTDRLVAMAENFYKKKKKENRGIKEGGGGEREKKLGRDNIRSHLQRHQQQPNQSCPYPTTT